MRKDAFDFGWFKKEKTLDIPVYTYFLLKMGKKYEPSLQWDSYMNDNECMFEGRQKGMGRVAFLIFTKIIVT